MSTKTDLLKLLVDNKNTYVSGQKIGDELNVSRNAIWKAIAQLKDEGYVIESKTKSGYRLISVPNHLTKDAVLENLNVDCDLIVEDTVTSTNDVVKSMHLSEKPVVLIADKQTGGRGRFGKKFESPSGTGLYLTLGIKPRFDIEKSLYVTMAAAVAVCKSVSEICHTEAQIKWVNDVFLNGKKICGILTEGQMSFEEGKIDALIIGIGINCFPGSFPEELKDIAGVISEDRSAFSMSKLAAKVVNTLVEMLDDIESKSFLKEYRDRCFVLGKEVIAHKSYRDEGVRALALDIANDGGLIIRYLEGENEGVVETVHTGEISITVI